MPHVTGHFCVCHVELWLLFHDFFPVPGYLFLDLDLGTWVPGYLGTWVPGYLGTWVPGYLGTWVPGYLGTWVPGYLGTWVPGYLGTWVPGYLGTWVPGYLGTWVPGYLGTWVPGYLGTWVPGYLGTWVPGYLGTWVPGYLGTWVPGYLGTWAPGYLGTWAPGCACRTPESDCRTQGVRLSDPLGLRQKGPTFPGQTAPCRPKKYFPPVESGRRALRARLPANHRGYYIAPLASTKKVVLCEAVIFFCAENSAEKFSAFCDARPTYTTPTLLCGKASLLCALVDFSHW